MRCEVLLINLDGSEARLASASAALAAAGIAFRRLPAFDGRKLRPEELPLYDAAEASRRFGRRLTGGEVGCFLSHIEAARQIAASGADYGLALEDDLTVPANAGEVLDALLTGLEQGLARTPWHLINLGSPARRLFTPLGNVAPGHQLMRAHYFPVTTTAILWNADGARAFVRDATEVLEPVDHWLRAWATTQDKGLALNAPLFPAAGAASEIDAAGPRKSLGRDGGYFWRKHSRLQGNKLRAWWHKRQFAALALQK